MTGLRFHTGWQKRWRQGVFVLSCLKYLRRDRYPLFSVTQALKLPRISRMLGLGKLPEFNGSYFPSPTLPHRPSRAFDRMVARGGLNFDAAGTPQNQQVGIVLMGITRRCDLRCAHCYERFNVGPDEVVAIGRWKEVLRDVQRVGAGVIALSGGEPMLRYDGLLELLRSGDKDLSDFHVHTSGVGVTPERARELRSAGLTAAAVGLDDVDPARHDALRGYPGAHRQALDALRAFGEAGVFTYTNVCLTRALIRSGGLSAYYELTRRLHVGVIEMLEPRPCGGYASGNADVLLTDEDRSAATEFYLRGNMDKRYRGYPMVSYVAYNEAPHRLGCGMGGMMQLHIDSKGNVNPCVFLPVTFGNILAEDYESIYRRMRASVPHPVRGECPAVALAPALRAAAAGGGWPVAQAAVREQWDGLIANSRKGAGTC